ncbi:response regulator transcription factor [Hydrogenimonas thermophila]|uniref:DNA-binding response regulator, OmpR family, contains REC and winged-helix (WHTH) domain n=1 Tax=Hydrogenimonas thermophila TaxID=223786 RepID=A0A1I5M0H2_9BACT|nr:response regulator transcription factor [Hydrogenimonas thermophila]WOE70537.1 response regulator transcription factor [Hydrogenimonas thermophila]WOE73053.1 response regulator transcription factor [Hydrogenimonas thermophila]SFP03098.1 DNA-binding response regulator, OmpR family, contains REC and winged-helix (wHTH) domain [Hydrogenimonas thermophila]
MELNELYKLSLLYVEDDESVSQSYASSFELFFQNVYIAKNYEEALEIYAKNSPDIILVDIELKNSLNGMAIVKKIREDDVGTPIVFLTSYSDNKYLMEAINLQIDGYIIKPLDIVNFQQSMLKCLKKIRSQQIVTLDSKLYYDFDSLELFEENIKVKLGKKENLLLQLFLKNRNKIISRNDLEFHIWNDNYISDSAIKNLIGSLRRKIGKEKIINISKIGWKINIE